MYYAHSTKNPDKSDWQLLNDHLENVAKLASEYASDFNAGEFAYAAGLLHDVGKYSPEFQRRLEGSPMRVDHATAGALEARSHYNKAYSRFLEYIITGHHGGILNYGSSASGLEERLNRPGLPDYSDYKDEIAIPDMESVLLKIIPLKDGKRSRLGFSIAFLTRMLYSCLVDADSLDTEKFLNPENFSLRGNYDSFEFLFKRFEDHMAHLNSGGEETRINRFRREIYEECREKADLPPQMFTLTVPTGGGKTLSSMAFALNHLKKNGLKRIFYVIPYTSIIEQNAEVFRKIFGSPNVLEHHSNFDPKTINSENSEGGDRVHDLSAENWDVPIIVTTNVQFFESLFSNKRSKSRKLHNLTKSVIILDEAQMLPTEYLKPCLAALSELVQNYGSSVVFCTATQPNISELLDESIKPVEITQSPQDLYNAFRRVHVSNLGALNDTELSTRLRELGQVLCIVNTRKHAKNLFDSLSGLEHRYHLSARMCPVHRRKHLEIIKNLLKKKIPCHVISTQLIEAGVDIDFPVVFRVMTGVDSVAQAAGRCNREGSLASGEVCLFKSTESYGKATSWQRRVGEIGEMVMDNSDDYLSLSTVREYFQKLYTYEGEDGLDKKKILMILEERVKDLAFPFEDISTSFNLIEDGTKEIIIPYDDIAKSAIQKLRTLEFPWKEARRLQGYSVSIYPDEFEELKRAEVLELIGDRFYVLKEERRYSEETGLINRYIEGTEDTLLLI